MARGCALRHARLPLRTKSRAYSGRYTCTLRAQLSANGLPTLAQPHIHAAASAHDSLAHAAILGRRHFFPGHQPRVAHLFPTNLRVSQPPCAYTQFSSRQLAHVPIPCYGARRPSHLASAPTSTREIRVASTAHRQVPRIASIPHRTQCRQVACGMTIWRALGLLDADERIHPKLSSPHSPSRASPALSRPLRLRGACLLCAQTPTLRTREQNDDGHAPAVPTSQQPDTMRRQPPSPASRTTPCACTTHDPVILAASTPRPTAPPVDAKSASAHEKGDPQAAQCCLVLATGYARAHAAPSLPVLPSARSHPGECALRWGPHAASE
ncbi:hypothetical protein C8R47DRAFT_1229445 [Mycena vitilis]|nr:hypothetical protein C8R47DRAFT_1229445 [Mycena vitilis]